MSTRRHAAIALLAVAGCKTVYRPNLVNVPLLVERGEAHVAASTSDLQASYAVTRNVGGQITAVTGLDKDKVVLVAQDVGGSFGVRGAVYAEYFAVMLAARKLGRPVKWISTRAETFMTDFQGRALSLTG